MPFRARPWQKTMEFVDGLEGDLPDEELAAIKRYVERRSREAAGGCPASQYSTSLYYPLAQSRDTVTCICQYGIKEEGRMNPELTELEPPSTGTGLETRTAKSLERGDMGERTNHRRRLFARWHGI